VGELAQATSDIRAEIDKLKGQGVDTSALEAQVTRAEAAASGLSQTASDVTAAVDQAQALAPPTPG